MTREVSMPPVWVPLRAISHPVPGEQILNGIFLCPDLNIFSQNLTGCHQGSQQQKPTAKMFLVGLVACKTAMEKKLVSHRA